MEKVVVFGGSGFMGSHVADILSENGYMVTIFDNQKSIYLKKNQKIIVKSVLDKKEINKAIKGAKYVYHFAAVADIQKAIEDPIETINVNFISTNLILDACVKHKVTRLLFASTVYVYSNFGSFYKTSKQCCELLIENYNKVYNLNCSVIRFGSLYGSRANDFNPIKKIINQAIIEKKITRDGDGNEIRSYIHVLDAAKACLNMLNSSISMDYVMVTGNQTMSIKKMLMMINEMMDHKIEIVYSKNKNDEHYKVTPYNFKKPNIARKINLEYNLDLGQGILDYIYEIQSGLKK
jgi:UDP-glucose 4-epimerase|tara:strand:- start:2642 stop:3520 length:879 start_codon:yes stop_codon:yes gene_type:complete